MRSGRKSKQCLLAAASPRGGEACLPGLGTSLLRQLALGAVSDVPLYPEYLHVRNGVPIHFRNEKMQDVSVNIYSFDGY